jgi:WNK lysine deficient protein kinase
MRWLKAKYQMELRERKDQQLGLMDNKTSHSGNGGEHITDYAAILSLSLAETLNGGNNGIRLKTVHKSSPNSDTVRNQICEAMESPGGEGMVTAKSFYTGSLLPHSLHRTVSLPVDAVDI